MQELREMTDSWIIQEGEGVKIKWNILRFLKLSFYEDILEKGTL